MVDLTFYNCTSDKRKVDKSNDVTRIYATNGYLKEQTDVVHPTFIINKPSNSKWDDFNYIYSEYFGRFYFVDKIRVGVGKQLEIDCTCDVLMSYRTDILKRSCVIARQETNFAGQTGIFTDSQYPIRSDRKVRKKAIGQVTTSYGYYVTVNGGVSS